MSGNAQLSDRIKEEIMGRINEKTAKSKFKEGTLEEAKEKISPWFSHTDKEFEGNEAFQWVWLSSLVPNWKEGKDYEDVRVRLFMRSYFAEAAQARIPEIDPVYRPNLKSLCELAYSIDHTVSPVMLEGMPSVGKSSLQNYFNAITNRPMFRFNYNGTMDSASLLGTQSAKAGSTQWHDGLIAEAIQVPYAVLLNDEWSCCPPEVVMAMQYLLERNGKLLLPDKPGSAADKFITPAVGVRIVFADNTKGNGDATGKFVGTQPQNSATLDRIGSFIHVDFLPKNDEIDMLQHVFPDLTKRLASAMVGVAGLCRTAYAQGNLPIIMSARVLFSWAEHALNLKDYKKALEIAYVNRFDSESERQAVLGFVQTVFGKGE